MDWIWTIALGAVGQAVCITSVVRFRLAHPTAKYPAWRFPPGQNRQDRAILGVGNFLSTVGALITAYAAGGGWLGALIVICCLTPAIIAIVVSNMVAARRRAGQPSSPIH